MRKSEAIRLALKLSLENSGEIVLLYWAARNNYDAILASDYLGEDSDIIGKYQDGHLTLDEE